MSNMLFAIGLLLGLDSLAVCAGLGTLRPNTVRRRWLALSFGVCDGLASLLGSALGVERLRAALAWCEWFGPALVGGYGLYVLYHAWRCQSLERFPSGGWLAFGLPIGLSLDNLVAGVGPTGFGLSAVLAAA